MRLDLALVKRGLARSRNQAAQLIAQQKVWVDGKTATKPAQLVAETTAIVAEAQPWASRAAHKLLGALTDSGTQVSGRVLDAGASHGGFTQVCLESGARRVYAVDVGHGQLVPELREHPRVSVREGLNLRYLTLSDLDLAPVDLVVGDVSFISLRLLLAPLLSVLDPKGQALLLVKPQFEVGQQGLDGRGVVTDPRLRQWAVDQVVAEAASLGWGCNWRGPSRLPGSHGNEEIFIRLGAIPPG